MKYKHYEYIGDKIGTPLYYCIEEEKFYLHNVPIVTSKKLSALIIPLTPFFSVIVKSWIAPNIYYDEKIFVVLSAFLGVGIALFLSIYGKRMRTRYFSEIQPSEPLPKETLKELVRYEIGMNWTWRLIRLIFPITLIGVPIMLRGGKNLFLLISYPILWFGEAMIVVDVNLRNRKKMIKSIKKTYIKNQDNQEGA